MRQALEARRQAARRARARAPAAQARRSARAPPAPRRRRPPARRRRSSRGRPARSTSARRSPVTSAPIGRPPPSALAIVIASGTTPVCSYAHRRAGAAHPGLDLVEDRAPRRARRRRRAPRAAAPRRARARRSRPGSARASPPRCWPSTAAASACGVGRRRRGSPGPAARTAPAWPPAASPTARRRCGRGSAPCTTTTSPPGLALRAQLDRRLVRLGAGVAEEHLAAEARRGQRARPAASPARCRTGC